MPQEQLTTKDKLQLEIEYKKNVARIYAGILAGLLNGVKNKDAAAPQMELAEKLLKTALDAFRKAQ